MYNRYIPQADGSYRRSRMKGPEDHRPQQPKHSEPPHIEEKPAPCPKVERPRTEQPKPHHIPADSFLKQLLPKNLDTGDLIVVLLLLLMAGDCQEDRNTAMLTLALYLFM